VDDKQRGILLCLISIVMASVSPVLAKLSLGHVNAETNSVLFFAFANIIYILFFITLGKREIFRMIYQNAKEMALLGLVTCAGNLLWSYGILYVGPTNSSFIFQFSSVFTVLLGVTFLRERFTRSEGIGILIAITGAFLMTYDIQEMQLTILVPLVSSLFYAIQNILAKVYVKNLDPISVVGGRSLFTLLFLLSYSGLSGRLQTDMPANILLYTFLGGLLGTFLGILLFYKALSFLQVSKAIAIRSGGPFFTAIYSFLMLSLMPTMTQFIGGTIIVLGIIAISLGKESPKQKINIEETSSV